MKTTRTTYIFIRKFYHVTDVSLLYNEYILISKRKLPQVLNYDCGGTSKRLTETRTVVFVNNILIGIYLPKC